MGKWKLHSSAHGPWALPVRRDRLLPGRPPPRPVLLQRPSLSAPGCRSALRKQPCEMPGRWEPGVPPREDDWKGKLDGGAVSTEKPGVRLPLRRDRVAFEPKAS